MATEILVIEREAAIAHPSYAAGGYVVLNQGSTAYRNADLVARKPKDVLDWCLNHRCDVVLLPDPAPSTRRHLVRFPDDETFAAFKIRFGPRG